MRLDRVRSDTLPENTDYSRIDGCEVAVHCMDCPLDLCKFDAPRANIWERNKRVFELRKKGVPIPELARAFNLSKRSIYRIIRHGGGATVRSPQIGHNDAPGIDPKDVRTHSFTRFAPWPEIPGYQPKPRVLDWSA